MQGVWKEWRDLEYRRSEQFAPVRKQVTGLKRSLSNLQHRLQEPQKGYGGQRDERDVAEIQRLLEHFEVGLCTSSHSLFRSQRPAACVRLMTCLLTCRMAWEGSRSALGGKCSSCRRR